MNALQPLVIGSPVLVTVFIHGYSRSGLPRRGARPLPTFVGINGLAPLRRIRERRYTTKLTQADLEKHAPGIALTTNLFQEYIPKAFELRINVIGTRVFAAEIHSQHRERAKIDFRMGYSDLIYQIHQLPEAIEQACLSLVQRFHLQFSAIDMLVTPDNKYIFLELNACGQWGWIEAHTGLPLTEALVDLLATR